LPNIKSAKKRVLVSAKKRLQNRKTKTDVKYHAKAFEVAMTGDDTAARETTFKAYTSSVDRAGSKGIFHKNKVNRTKSRMAKRVNKA